MSLEDTAPAIFWGTVGHQRFGPQKHEFSYPLFLLAINLTLTESLPTAIAYNRPGICSIREVDYLPSSSTGSLRQRAYAQFAADPADEIVLLTMPRFLGYVFNPVNFYCVFSNRGVFKTLWAEVHNTFGETHLYRCDANTAPNGELVRASFPKKFYVSPFLDRAGDYTLVLSRFDQELSLSIALRQDEEQIFSAGITAQRRPLSSLGIYQSLVRFGLGLLLVMCRIHWHAVLLALRRGAPIFIWRQHPDPMTIASRQSWIHRTRLRILRLLNDCAHLLRKIAQRI